MTFLQKAKRFLAPLKQSPKYLTLSCIKFIFWAIYSLAIVILIKNTSHALELKNYDMFHQNVIYFSYFVVVYFIANYLGRRWEWPRLYYIIEEYIADTYVKKMLLIDNNYIESIGTGKLISIMSNGIKRWTELLSFLLRDFTRSMVIFITTIYILYSMNHAYGIMFLLLVIIIHILVGWIDTFARSYRKIRTEKRHEYSRKLVQIIMSKMEILQNNQSHIRTSELTAIHREIENADDKVARSIFFIFNIPRGFLAIARIGILYLIGYQVFSGVFTITDFTLAMTILLMFETFLLDSVESYKNFTKEFSDIQSFWDTIHNGPQMQGYDSGLDFAPHKKDIEINSISYGYNETRVFDNFSLTIKRGQKTALVGASGGGKTTLMKLIAGYLHPEEGSVSILGNELGKTALKSYYPHIGYLTQDPSVFDATIRENLVSSMQGAVIREESAHIKIKKGNHSNNGLLSTDHSGELERALRLAHCDFVFDLENGLDTEIGERGVRLSGGQKQRLAIAKIFLKDPEIILLDEPTSALDSFSEEAITIALDELFKNRTVIIVAHRLQTVRKADEIIVLEQGQVTERGTHMELVEKGGIYNRMLELQSGF